MKKDILDLGKQNWKWKNHGNYRTKILIRNSRKQNRHQWNSLPTKGKGLRQSQGMKKENGFKQLERSQLIRKTKAA